MSSTPAKTSFVFGGSASQSSPIAPASVNYAGLDSTLVVILKGLAKRDVTTRVRSSEELTGYLAKNEEIGDEETFLKVWTTLYAALSIDIDRRVRGNAHQVTGTVVARYRKKTLQFLASMAPYWQLGQQDADKSVSRSARETFEACFPTEQKRLEFLNIFRHETKNRCEELAFETSSDSLSDARFINADDALAKYSNVIGAALAVLSCLPCDADELLIKDSIWERCRDSDLHIQRTALQWISELATSRTAKSDECLISGLSATLPNIGPSNLTLLLSIVLMVAKHNASLVFEDASQSKKSLLKRLISCIKRHSSSAYLSSLYWSTLRDLCETATNSSVDLPADTQNLVLLTFVDVARANTRSTRAIALLGAAHSCVGYLAHGSTDAKELLMRLLAEDIDVQDFNSYADVVQQLKQLDLEAFHKVINALAKKMVIPVEEHLDTVVQFCTVLSAIDPEEGVAQCMEVLHTLPTLHLNDDRPIKIYRTISSIHQQRLSDPYQAIELLRKNPSSALNCIEDTILLLQGLDDSQRDQAIQSILKFDDERSYDLLRGLVDADMEGSSLWQWIDDRIAHGGLLLQADWDIIFASTLHKNDLSTIESLLLRNEVVDPAHLRHCTCRLLQEHPSILTDHIDIAAKLVDELFLNVSDEEGSSIREAIEHVDRGSVLAKIIHHSVMASITSIKAPRVGILLSAVPKSFLPVERDIVQQLSLEITESLPPDLYVLHPLGVLTRYLKQGEPLGYDIDGYSALLRVSIIWMENVSDEVQIDLCLVESMLQISELVSTDVSICAKSSLTNGPHLAAFRSKASVIMDNLAGSILKSKTIPSELLPSKDDHTSRAFYQSLLLYQILARLINLNPDKDFIESLYTQILSSGSKFSIVAGSSAFKEDLEQSKKAAYQRNKLASRISPSLQPEELYSACIELRALLVSNSISRQRAINLLRDLVAIFAKLDAGKALVVPVVDLLLILVEDLKSEYGSFWGTLIETTTSLLASAIHCHQKSTQYVLLKVLSWYASNLTANDDLQDFWLNASTRFHDLVLDELVQCRESADQDQVTMLCSLNAARLLRGISYTLWNASQRRRLIELLMFAEHIQATTKVVLESCIEQEREQMTVNAALTKEYEELDMNLPEELLSIVLDPPFQDEDKLLESTSIIPASYRGYCMAWQLLFKYFPATPLRMRSKFVEDLDNLGVLHDLLAFILIILRVGDTRPVDLTNISKVSLDGNFSDGHQELCAYAAHLYHLCLLHTPGRIRAWWIECKDRNLVSAVDSFTEKFYSSSMILADVQAIHSPESKRILNDANLSVKVSNAGKDIFSSYEIDDQKMEMVIHMPANYPLRKVNVEGLQRVGVKDAQWRAWLLASQSILTAQNGSLLDAISLFQRNISLHFEGVADCAICFSILSGQDKSLPSKRCSTCKNLFHGSCLYKWFKSSSQSRCPLCRNSFAF